STPPAPTSTSTLSLHDALPISVGFTTDAALNRSGNGLLAPLPLIDPCQPTTRRCVILPGRPASDWPRRSASSRGVGTSLRTIARSEEHTSELQSLTNLVCRLLL